MNTQTENPQEQIQVRKSKWKLSDRPGVFLELDKNEILFDLDYQREEKELKILEIAKNWSWVACGIIIIAERDSKFFAIDGQHRVLAARKRPDITTLPCLCFESSGVKEEAEGFLAANTNRKPLSAADRFRAKVTAEDENAIHIKELIESSGLKASSTRTPNAIRCVGAIERLSREKRPALDKIFPLICEISKGEMIDQKVLMSLVHIEHKLNESGESLLNSVWDKKIKELGISGIKDAIAKAMRYYPKSGVTTWMNGVADILNKGRRKNLIRIEFDEDEITK